MKPIFLVSLPRSGSTVLQRTLAAHSAISTSPEPWIALPIASILGAPNARYFAEYSQKTMRAALQDAEARLPQGRESLLAAFRGAVETLYMQLSDRSTQYFLDKTPRYFLIVDFLLELFPDAKLVVLVRNPLDILSSMITTWGHDRLWLHHSLLDLFHGPRLLHEAVRGLERSVHVVRYERFVAEPEDTCIGICSFLDLEYEPTMLAGSAVGRVQGVMGDQSANLRRDSLTREPIGRWRTVLDTHLRRAFALRYLSYLGDETLSTFGVDMAEARGELEALSVGWRHVGSDFLALLGSFVAPAFAATVIRAQWSGNRPWPIAKLD